MESGGACNVDTDDEVAHRSTCDARRMVPWAWDCLNAQARWENEQCSHCIYEMLCLRDYMSQQYCCRSTRGAMLYMQRDRTLVYDARREPVDVEVWRVHTCTMAWYTSHYAGLVQHIWIIMNLAELLFGIWHLHSSWSRPPLPAPSSGAQGTYSESCHGVMHTPSCLGTYSPCRMHEPSGCFWGSMVSYLRSHSACKTGFTIWRTANVSSAWNLHNDSSVQHMPDPITLFCTYNSIGSLLSVSLLLVELQE